MFVEGQRVLRQGMQGGGFFIILDGEAHDFDPGPDGFRGRARLGRPRCRAERHGSLPCVREGRGPQEGDGSQRGRPPGSGCGRPVRDQDLLRRSPRFGQRPVDGREDAGHYAGQVERAEEARQEIVEGSIERPWKRKRKRTWQRQGARVRERRVPAGVPGDRGRRPGPPPPTGEAPAVFHGAAERPRTQVSAVRAFSVTPLTGQRLLQVVPSHGRETVRSRSVLTRA